MIRVSSYTVRRFCVGINSLVNGGNMSASAITSASATSSTQVTGNLEPRVFTPKVGDITGYRTYSEEEATTIQLWRSRLQDVFERAGFSAVENRPVERTENLLVKGGLNKEIYGLCRAENGQQVAVGLPFDRTVPFALWLAQHKATVAFPFKRWDIDYSYRGEHAVAKENRFRGFIQADVDIADYNMDNRIQADAECVATIIRALESLNVPPFVMNINHIRIARAIIMEAGIPEKKVQFVLGQLDKLDKKTKEEVIGFIQEQVTELTANQIEELIDKFDFKGNIENFKPGNDWGNEAKSALKELQDLFALVQAFGVKKEQVVFNLRMVRGLDYYTGVVAETFFTQEELSKYGSIASGGRYDGLVDVFEKKPTGIQGVGFSIGVTRLFSVLLNEKRIDTSRRGNADVLIGFRTQDELLKAVEIAQALRERGLRVDLYSGNKKINQQFKYAAKKGIPYTLCVMNSQNSFVVKNMKDAGDTRGSDCKTVEDAINLLMSKTKSSTQDSAKPISTEPASDKNEA